MPADAVNSAPNVVAKTEINQSKNQKDTKTSCMSSWKGRKVAALVTLAVAGTLALAAAAVATFFASYIVAGLAAAAFVGFTISAILAGRIKEVDTYDNILSLTRLKGEERKKKCDDLSSRKDTLFTKMDDEIMRAVQYEKGFDSNPKNFPRGYKPQKDVKTILAGLLKEYVLLENDLVKTKKEFEKELEPKMKERKFDEIELLEQQIAEKTKEIAKERDNKIKILNDEQEKIADEKEELSKQWDKQQKAIRKEAADKQELLNEVQNAETRPKELEIENEYDQKLQNKEEEFDKLTKEKDNQSKRIDKQIQELYGSEFTEMVEKATQSQVKQKEQFEKINVQCTILQNQINNCATNLTDLEDRKVKLSTYNTKIAEGFRLCDLLEIRNLEVKT